MLLLDTCSLQRNTVGKVAEVQSLPATPNDPRQIESVPVHQVATK
jgi:hypothetical protein